MFLYYNLPDFMVTVRHICVFVYGDYDIVFDSVRIFESGCSILINFNFKKCFSRSYRANKSLIFICFKIPELSGRTPVLKHLSSRMIVVSADRLMFTGNGYDAE